MEYVLAKSTRHLIWRIRRLALIISIVFIFGSSPVIACGGGHSGGHEGGHSGGHGGHSGGHRGHHGGHTGNKHGQITSGTTARDHFMNQNPCPPDKMSEDCPKLDQKQGKSGTVPVQTAPSGARFVKLNLDPHQFVILA